MTTGKKYFCSSRNEFVEGHSSADECILCLRAMRDEWRRLANADLVERLRNQERRIREQRRELARLNTEVGCLRETRLFAAEREAHERGIAIGMGLQAGITALGEWARRCGKPVCTGCGIICVEGHVAYDGVPWCFACDRARWPR